MSVFVCEALQSETGGKDGAPGDQSGKEIVRREFKKRSYSFTSCLCCTCTPMAKDAAKYAEMIAENAKFGYSQPNRWDGAKAIEAAGKDLDKAGAGDFDCSSLVIECYRLAGLNVKMTGYTGSMEKILLSTGLFTEAPEVLTDIEYARVGDVLIAPGIHTLMIVTDGSKAEHEEDDIDQGDQYVLIKGDNVRIRSGPGKTYKTIAIAHKGEKYPYLETDEDTGWYWISTRSGTGCITNKTRYTELI